MFTDEKKPTGLRVLGRLRISRTRLESTSIESQRQIVQQWADANSHRVIGWAIDEEVSGSVDAFDAPELGPWLRERSHEFDVVCSRKLDRLGRNSIQLNKLFGWCNDHDKALVCVSDNIDLSTWVGRLIANVIAGLAEGELEQIRERVLSSKRKLREDGRWTGGRPPYGYRGVPLASGGQVLDIDPETAPVVRSVIERVLRGDAVSQIAEDLSDQGVLTPADLNKVRNGKPAARARWRRSTLFNQLASPALRGYVMHQGDVVRDDDGRPVRKGPELVTSDEFDRLQSKLAERRKPMNPTRTNTTSPLLGVVVCYECDRPLHHKAQHINGKVWRYYVCGNKHGGQIRADQLEPLLEQTFLEEHGDDEVLERRFLPSESHEDELAELIASQDGLTRLYASAKSQAARDRYERQLESLDTRIAELELLPVREARYEMVGTGRTYASEWDSHDTDARRRMLIDSGITCAALRVKGTNALRFDLRVP